MFPAGQASAWGQVPTLHPRSPSCAAAFPALLQRELGLATLRPQRGCWCRGHRICRPPPSAPGGISPSCTSSGVSIRWWLIQPLPQPGTVLTKPISSRCSPAPGAAVTDGCRECRGAAAGSEQEGSTRLPGATRAPSPRMGSAPARCCCIPEKGAPVPVRGMGAGGRGCCSRLRSLLCDGQGVMRVGGSPPAAPHSPELRSDSQQERRCFAFLLLLQTRSLCTSNWVSPHPGEALKPQRPSAQWAQGAQEGERGGLNLRDLPAQMESGHGWRCPGEGRERQDTLLGSSPGPIYPTQPEAASKHRAAPRGDTHPSDRGQFRASGEARGALPVHPPPRALCSPSPRALLHPWLSGHGPAPVLTDGGCTQGVRRGPR